MSKTPFLWGVATSAHQIEGYNEHSDWWKWEAEGNIEGGARSGPATDHIHRLEEDLDLIASLGCNSYRFSIEWAKIEPLYGEISEDALKWYEQLITACESRGIIPMPTLLHFTLPQWASERGGYCSDDFPFLFEHFSKLIADRFASRIPFFCTINEPLVSVVGGYLAQFMPPAIYSTIKAEMALKNLLLAHARSYRVLATYKSHRTGPFAHLPLRIGIAHNLMDFLPARWWNLRDRLATLAIGRFYNYQILDAISGRSHKLGVPGLFHLSLKDSQNNHELVAGTLDFIGVNYYTKCYVQSKPKLQTSETLDHIPLALAFARPKETQSDLGWAIHPKGFRRILKSLRRYSLPLIVTENGIADREDKHRSEYLVSHLREIAEINSGSLEILGYYHWSLLDNFEWIKGFGPRFGLFEVDYQSFERRSRESAQVYRRIIRDHGTAAPDKDLLLT